MEFDSDNLPVFGAQYVSDMHAKYKDSLFDLSNVVHDKFTENDAPPAEGETTIHRFGSRVTATVRMFGQDPVRLEAHADCTVSVKWLREKDGVRVYEAQMTQLDVYGGDLPDSLLLRVSLNLPSKGVTTIETLPNGLYKIESYFDIYTELSIDSGAHWFPSETGAARMTLVDRSAAPAEPEAVLAH